MLGKERGELDQLLDTTLKDAFLVERDGELIVLKKTFDAVKDAALGSLAAYHTACPGDVGISVTELQARVKKCLSLAKTTVPKRIPGKTIDCFFNDNLLEKLTGQGLVSKQGAIFALSAHSPASSMEEKKVEQEIARMLGTEFKTRKLEELQTLEFKADEITRALEYLVERGEAIKLKRGVFISGQAVSEARKRLAGFFATNTTIKAKEFRDLLGCGRKLAIEILEYFDRENVTLRKDDLRTLR